MKPVTITPAYVAFYPALTNIAREHGYALAIHGSVASDMDLIAVPWVDDAKPVAELVNAISKFAGSVMAHMFDESAVLHGPEQKPHGRIAYTIAIGNGNSIDLSIQPAAGQAQQDAEKVSALPSHEKLAELLQSIGWKSSNDAQWENLRDVMPTISIMCRDADEVDAQPNDVCPICKCPGGRHSGGARCGQVPPDPAMAGGEWISTLLMLVKTYGNLRCSLLGDYGLPAIRQTLAEITEHARKRVQLASGEDTARLDFLIENELVVINSGFDGVDMYYVVTPCGEPITADFSEPRAAIDNAMQQGPQQ